ncbi:MAG TPA: hypothetical protein VN278_04420, partial [Methanosarcina sp.]|nr:hypothetical protein [Methanosarcina sp.]
MLECEVRFDYGEDTFQLEQIGPRNFHNAYDADENGAFFRADALFTHENKAPIEVPVFAAQMSDRGPWRWYVRFRPTETGRWILRIRVLSQSGGEPVRFGFDSNDYERNPDAQRRFVVY